MARIRGDRGWSLTIILIAAGLLVMAAIDFIRPDRGETVDLGARTEWAGMGRGGEVVELHRLLPDATADLGREVLVAGTIVGEVDTEGFWVRDLRDNIIHISDRSGGAEMGLRRPGQTVRVRGTIAILAPPDQAGRLRAAGLVISAGSNLIREIEVQAGPGGIEVLRD